MVELLKQPQYRPLSVYEQILSLYAGTRGFLDDVPVKQVSAWEAAFLQYVHDQHGGVLKALADKQELTDEISEQIESAIQSFKSSYKLADES
jgi:F-type H+-transporting ATPase subunit alpha